VGYVFAYTGFLGILLQGGLIGRLVARLGERKVVAIGFASSLLSYCVLAASSSVPILLISSTLGALGNSALRPALTSLVTQKVGRNHQGVVLGLTQSLMSVAQILSPFASGLLIQHGLLALWALLAGVFALGGLVLAVKQVEKPAAI